MHWQGYRINRVRLDAFIARLLKHNVPFSVSMYNSSQQGYDVQTPYDTPEGAFPPKFMLVDSKTGFNQKRSK